MKNETLKQVIDMALESGQYRTTDLRGWIGHIVCLAQRGHLEVVRNANDTVIGFATWIRTRKPITEPPYILPEDMDRGDYIAVILTCVTEGGSETIRQLRDKIMTKAPTARYWQWAREKHGNRGKVYKVKRRAA